MTKYQRMTNEDILAEHEYALRHMAAKNRAGETDHLFTDFFEPAPDNSRSEEFAEIAAEMKARGLA